MYISAVQNSADIHTAFNFFDRFRLVNGQALHQPYILLTGQTANFLFVSGPVEFAVLKSFIQQEKSIILPQQNFQSVPASSTEKKCTIIEQIKVILLLHYSCKSVNGFPHIRMTADNVDIIGFQILQHCFSPLSSEYIIFSETSGGSMISIPFLRITMFSFGRTFGTTVSELVVPLSWITLSGTIS